MGRRAARATHLALTAVGAVLFFLFVIPRWWVLTGDLPATLSTVGRIATGVPIAAAAVPVALTLQNSLKPAAKTPELALRLRAWSAVLHLIAGVLIIATAVAEVWLSLESAGPWLFGVYGAAGAVAVLAALAFLLSFTAEKPPGPPRPAKAKSPTKPKAVKPAGDTKPVRKRRTRKSQSEAVPAESEDITTSGDSALQSDPADEAEPPAETEPAPEPAPAAQAGSDTQATPEAADAKRPTGKNRHRLRR